MGRDLARIERARARGVGRSAAPFGYQSPCSSQIFTIFRVAPAPKFFGS
jgi:hypothetical protein